LWRGDECHWEGEASEEMEKDAYFSYEMKQPIPKGVGKKYKMVSDNDPNVSIVLDADNENAAAIAALNELGYHLVEDLDGE